MGHDAARKPAGRNGRRFVTEFLPDPFDHTVQAGRLAHYDTALHTIDGICANDLFRRFQTNLGQLGSPVDKGIQRNFNARQDHAADVIFLLIYHTDRRRSSHIDQNDRRTVIL